MQLSFGGAALRLLEIPTLTLPQLARVLDRLLGARNLRTDLVVAALDAVERFGCFRKRFARRFDRRFDGAEICDRGLHIAVSRSRMMPSLVCESCSITLRRRASSSAVSLRSVLLEALGSDVRSPPDAAGGAICFVDFLADVAQALEVLFRVRDAVLGLAAALLVLGDAGRLLDEAAQLLGRAPR